jgi:hypothetical protein
MRVVQVSGSRRNVGAFFAPLADAARRAELHVIFRIISFSRPLAPALFISDIVKVGKERGEDEI